MAALEETNGSEITVCTGSTAKHQSGRTPQPHGKQGAAVRATTHALSFHPRAGTTKGEGGAGRDGGAGEVEMASGGMGLGRIAS